MSETQNILAAYNDLESAMERFSNIANSILGNFEEKELVPDDTNTDMLECIMELQNKQKNLVSLYQSMELGDEVPTQMNLIKEKIDVLVEEEEKENRKIEYLEAVKQSFLSLEADKDDVNEELQKYKDKVVKIQTDNYELDECLEYVRPYAVFLTMIKSDDMEKSVEQVPVMNDFFGSKLVANILSKSIKLGEGATDFTMDSDPLDYEAGEGYEEAEPVADDDFTEEMDEAPEPVIAEEPAEEVEEAPEPIMNSNEDLISRPPVQKSRKQNLEEDLVPPEINDDIQNEPFEDDSNVVPDPVSAEVEQEIAGTEAPSAMEEQFDTEEMADRPARPEKPKKVDLKALLEEDGFKESKLYDQELRDMEEGRINNEGKKKRGIFGFGR